MNANGEREEKYSCCYFHPKQAVVGVCPLCLNERLLIVAAKQGHHRPFATTASSQRLQGSIHRRKPSSSASIHKIFAFGSLFTRPESQQLKSENHHCDASPSPEDSFISIKFEENGVASWEENMVSSSNKVCVESSSSNKKMMSWNHQSQIMQNNKESKSVIEHRKSSNTFRWRKRLGRLFHLIQWKRSTKGVCHVGSKGEGVKVRKGWMRTLTKRKALE